MAKDEMDPDTNEIWKFPCQFPVKIMGVANDSLLTEVMKVVQQFAPGEYQPKLNPSKKGNFVSITVNILAKNKKQLDNIYQHLHQIEDVKMLL